MKFGSNLGYFGCPESPIIQLFAEPPILIYFHILSSSVIICKDIYITFDSLHLNRFESILSSSLLTMINLFEFGVCHEQCCIDGYS